MRVPKEKFCIGRVLNEDDDFMLLEIIKNERETINLDVENPESNRFYTVLFVHSIENGMEIWKPWEEDDDD